MESAHSSDPPIAATAPAANFDLAAYLDRIRLPAPPPADAEGLATLQRAHRLAIPFENLDVMLGRPIALDGPAMFAKLVTARRGGYCFEQGRLFGDALAALGFAARPLLARVWLEAEETPPQTHALSLVTIGGEDWIADAGFESSYSPPMPLRDGTEAPSPDGALWRLRADPVHGWMLMRSGDPLATDGRGAGAGWQRQYSFTLAPVFPADLMLANRWTSTAPESRFRQQCIVGLVLPQGLASLTDRAYRRRAGDRVAEAVIYDPRQYRLRLSLMFGIDLTATEVAALGLFDGG